MQTLQPGWSALLWFIAVLAAIPLALWLLKRSPMGGIGSGVPGTPRTVSVLPLSGQQKLVTVEVGQGNDRLWLVLGVTPQTISTLHAMSAQAAPPPAGAAAPSATFAQLLSRLRSRSAGDHEH